MSTHEVKVIRIKEILPHDNADKLEIIPVDGYQVCSSKGQFKVGDLAAYIEPDYCVDLSQPEFDFLVEPNKQRTHKRITVKKLRGVVSQGFIIPARPGWAEGDNVMEALGIFRYEPPEQGGGSGTGNAGKLQQKQIAPMGVADKKYDLENLLKSNRIFDGYEEDVYASVKIHGANARYVYSDGIMYIGSRNRWVETFKVYPSKFDNAVSYVRDKLVAGVLKLPFRAVKKKLVDRIRALGPPTADFSSNWGKAFKKYPQILEFCEENPKRILFGEIYGPGIQNLTYGVPQGDIAFAAFDLANEHGQFLNFSYSRTLFPEYDIPQPTKVFEGKYDLNALKELVEKDCPHAESHGLKGQVCEGVVARSLDESRHPTFGRRVVKLVSNRYYENS